MKKRVLKVTDDELIGYPIRDLVEGWFFRVDEVSLGFYRVEGIESWGRKVSRMGIDPEQLLRQCKNDIDEMKLS
jgi:hypothetical protein